MFLQIIQHGSPELVQRAFNTSPDTVYGLLVASLVIAVLGLSAGYMYLARQVIDLSRDAAMGLRATADGMERLDRRLDDIERTVTVLETRSAMKL